MENELERISWKDQSWKKEDGTKVTPEKIGDSFVVNSMRPFSYGEGNEKLQEFVLGQLNEYESLNYISKEQKEKVNAFSMGRPMEASLFRCSIGFYKI
jgi:hypothetical protein